MRAAALLLTACAVRVDDSGISAVPDLPQVDIPTANPQWTIEALQSAVNEALVDGFPRLDEGHEIYLELFAHGDDSCPGADNHIAIENLTGCTAESNFYYSGASSYSFEESDSDGKEHGKLRVHGDFLLRDDQGNALEVGGHIKQNWTISEEAHSITTELEGSWLWEGDTRWLAETLSGLVLHQVTREGERINLELDGALLFYGTHWFMEDFRIESGTDCDWHAQGAVSIRDPSGGWSRIELTGDCSGCGSAIFESDQVLGELCLPLDTWMGPAESMLEKR